MLWAIFGPSSNMRLDDVTSVQEWHLSVRLDPDFVACVLREDGQGGNVKAELSCLGKFAWSLLAFVLVSRIATYLDMSPTIGAYLAISKSPCLPEKGARSSISTGAGGRRIGRNWGCCRGAQSGSSVTFQCNSQASRTASESRFL